MSEINELNLSKLSELLEQESLRYSRKLDEEARETGPDEIQGLQLAPQSARDCI